MEPLVAPKTLDDLVSSLHRELAGDTADVKRVKWLMESYKACPEDYAQYVKWDPHRYTRTLVDRGNGKFNLIVLCWGEAQGSCIHAHSDSHCFMKILDGSLRESVFDWPEADRSCGDQSTLQVRESNDYCKGECAYINDSMGIHRVENASHTRKAISLHLYSPAFEMCKTFDERTGHVRTCRLTFTGHTDKTASKPLCCDT